MWQPELSPSSSCLVRYVSVYDFEIASYKMSGGYGMVSRVQHSKFYPNFRLVRATKNGDNEPAANLAQNPSVECIQQSHVIPKIGAK
jgi:hypothetical protein